MLVQERLNVGTGGVVDLDLHDRAAVTSAIPFGFLDERDSGPNSPMIFWCPRAVELAPAWHALHHDW
jgi:hypothetical protein